MPSIFQCVLIFYSFTISSCLYEDQIGKFEWRQQYVGKPKFASLDIASPIKKVILATEQNVLAALSLKSGDIIWKHVLEPDENDRVQMLSVDNEIITVSGQPLPLVRGWDLETGHLLWEWTVTPHDEYSKWISMGQKLLQIDFVAKSQIIVHLYNASNGKKLKTQVIPAPWVIPEGCILQSDVLGCITSDKLLYSVKLTDGIRDLDIKVHHRSLLDLFRENITGSLRGTLGPLPIVTLNVGKYERPIVLQPEIRVLESGSEKFEIFTTAVFDEKSILTSAYLENEELKIVTRNLNGDVLVDLNGVLTMPHSSGKPERMLIVCQPRKDKGIACRLLVITSHHVVALAQHPGKILWSREEALASIVNSEMVDLPVSDTDVAIEKEFNNKNSGFLGMFFRRLVSQSVQLQNLILTVMDLRRSSSTNEREGLVRDDFGLHKIIVAVTKPGKIYGIDNLTGKVIWQLRVDGIEPFPIWSNMPLFVLRTARHAPLPPKGAILAMEKDSKNSVLVMFNPITGQSSEKPMRLGFRVKQSLQSRHADEDFIKGIILLDEENRIHIFPETSKKEIASRAASTYIFAASPTGLLEGFVLTPRGEGFVGSKLWQLNLGLSGDKIIALVTKNPKERVHSQGRVLGDRSVLYKYVNPNLVAVMTQGHHPTSVLNLHLIDAVTGNIVHSVTHRRAKEPVHLVHSENWVVYTYFNEKYRRTELAALEMYEGKTQSNATAFSSVDSTLLLPIVERQAYILPTTVLALKETITEKGITSKHILVALASGGVLELPWVYVDPRRPITVTQEMREEGVIPYMPELPIPLETIINHNQTIMRVRGIHTSSSGLESTCLVFIYGLDLFYTRVAPSKMFDLLKDDFDYFVITSVLLALTIASYVTKKLASRKALKQAWK